MKDTRHVESALNYITYHSLPFFSFLFCLLFLMPIAAAGASALLCVTVGVLGVRFSLFFKFLFIYLIFLEVVDNNQRI